MQKDQDRVKRRLEEMENLKISQKPVGGRQGKERDPLGKVR